MPPLPRCHRHVAVAVVLAVAAVLAPVATVVAHPVGASSEEERGKAPGGPRGQSLEAALGVCDRALEPTASALDAATCYERIVTSGGGTQAAVARALEARLATDPSHPRWRLALALVLHRAQDPAAGDQYAAATAAFASSGDRVGQALALVLLASLQRQLAQREVAARTLGDARRVAVVTDDPNLRVRLETEAAWQSYGEADYGHALRALDTVSEVVPTVAPGVRARWLNARAAVAWALGDHEAARAFYAEQRAIFEAGGDLSAVAAVLVNLALLSHGETKVGHARRAADLAARVGEWATQAYALFYLSEAATGAESLRFARAAVEAARKSGDLSAQALTMRRLALALVTVDETEAFRLIEEAIQVARAMGDVEETVRQLVIRSIMRWRTGPRDRAIAESLDVLDAIERIRHLQPEDTVRAKRFAQWRYAYYRLAWHLLQGTLAPGDGVSVADRELAFATLERMRARLLLDRLDSAMVPSPGRLPEDHPLRQARRALLRQIADGNRLLMSRHLTDAERRRALADLQAWEGEEAAISARIAREDPAFAAARMPTTVSTAQVRAALGPDEAMVVLQVVDLPTDDRDRSYGGWVWVLTRDVLRVRRIEDARGLTARIDAFAGLIARRDAGAVEADAAARLYRDVFGGALDDLPPQVDRLILVADEGLPRLPFAALRATPGGPPLGFRYAITVAPSASTWRAWRGQPVDGAPSAALVLAAPTWPGSVAAGASGDRSGATPSPGWLADLPFARLEGRWLVRTFGPGSRVFSGPAATEARLREERLSQYRLLHFASHAVVDMARPERTAVVLAPGAAGDDGLLQVREIVDLPLDGQIVAISACESASGPLVPGEGLMGLAHAFFRAGARAVVANLWPVQDLESAEMFQSLARHLAAGRDLAEAATLARRERITAGAPAAAWAGVVVLGDGSVTVTQVTDPRRSRNMPLSLVGVGTLLLAGLALVGFRRRP